MYLKRDNYPFENLKYPLDLTMISSIYFLRNFGIFLNISNHDNKTKGVYIKIKYYVTPNIFDEALLKRLF